MSPVTLAKRALFIAQTPLWMLRAGLAVRANFATLADCCRTCGLECECDG